MKNDEVSKFINDLQHPLFEEIEIVRSLILNSVVGITENIKWNSPNYCFQGHDRITMRIQPPKQIQLIFHKGAKKTEQPKERIISDPVGMLDWKENDRAVLTLKNKEHILNSEINIKSLISNWIKALV